MRVKKLKNISNDRIKVVHKEGIIAYLPPGAEITDVEITNEKDLKEKASIVADLTEIVERDKKEILYD